MKYLLDRAISPRPAKRHLQEAEEDFLKAVYHAAQTQESTTLEAIAQGLGVSDELLAQIVGSLVLQGHMQSTPLRLTKQGEYRALRLIRAHRIYEKYLAEHSGYKPEDWHQMANKMEHHMSEEEQARIASLLRNPLFDPHGDPIPTHTLELPQTTQLVTGHITPGQWLRLLHIEDDDIELFAKINQTHLARNAVLQITQVTPDHFVFLYEGEQHTLPLVALEALTLTQLEPTDEAIEQARRVRRLTALSEGEEALIVALSPSCRGAMRRRLMDLGFVRGSRVSIEMRSPMGNPIAYVVRGSAIALRHDQAQYILIEKN